MDDYELNQSAWNVHTLLQRNSQVGNEKHFLTDKMDWSHMIQKAYAWAAVSQWLRQKDDDLLDNIQETIVIFQNTKDEMLGSAPAYTCAWNAPDPLPFTVLFDWIKKLPYSRLMRRKSNFLRYNHEYLCCTECNLLMDVKGRIWNLLWNVKANDREPLNPNDEDEPLIPQTAITISRIDGVNVNLQIPRKQILHNMDRQKLYTAVLSYYIHRCLTGLVQSFQAPHDCKSVHFRVCTLVCVCALKLLCWQKESIVRWSETSSEQRSRHNYQGVVRLFVSYVMYMMYLCDSGEDLHKAQFETFHLFYMNEIDCSPVWNKRQYKDVWNFVFRANELDDSTSSTIEQLKCIINNLVELYETYVSYILAVMHPTPSDYSLRLPAAQLATVENDLVNFFVDFDEVTELRKLHDQAKHQKKFSLHVRKIGFAPIGVGIRRMFSEDGDDCIAIIDKWMAQFIYTEYDRMKKKNNLRSIDAAKGLYLMCNMSRKELETEAIVTPGQNFIDILQTPSAVEECLRKLDSLPLISVWKAILILIPYGNRVYEFKSRNADLPARSANGFVDKISRMGLQFTTGNKYFDLSQCISMRTGRRLKND